MNKTDKANGNAADNETDKYQKLCDDSMRTDKDKANSETTTDSQSKMENLEIQEPKKESLLYKQISLLCGFVNQKQVYKPILFILAFISTPGYDDPMFYFYTNQLDFKMDQIGRLNFMGALAGVIGILLYKKWLNKYAFKSIMVSSTIIIVFFGIVTIVLVLRWNKALGIPDFLFAMGSGAITTALAEINMMPMCVLAANLCPKNIEGVTYALMMSVINLGLFLSYNFGSLLTTILGITSENFTNLWLLILISNLLQFIPLPILLWMDDVKHEHVKEVDEPIVVTISGGNVATDTVLESAKQEIPTQKGERRE